MPAVCSDAVKPPPPPPVARTPVPPVPPETSRVPATVTSPLARRSSTPLPLVVTVTPAGTLMVVKLCTPGASVTFADGAKAPSAPVLGNGLTSVQAPATQMVPPVQMFPHEPQLLLSPPVATSQPSVRIPLQFAKPVAHDARVQCDATHPETAFAAVHATPQPPQFATLLRVSISQPLDATPSQSRNPVAQVKPQTPAVHAAVAPAGVGHTPPQLPQCSGSVAKIASQPVAATPSQLPWPAVHVMPHAPEAHTAVAKGPVGHDEKHAPQFAGSLVSGVSQPSVAVPLQLP